MYKLTEICFLFCILYANVTNKETEILKRGEREVSFNPSNHPSLILNTVATSSTSVPFSEAYDHGTLQMMH